MREEHVRAFNWKVLVENYSENFHTPFVHPELIVDGWEYPIVTDGPISLAWDRPLAPRNAAERALQADPCGAGWEAIASNQIDDVFIAGVYFTVFPNLLVSVFPRYLSALLLTPLGPTRWPRRSSCGHRWVIPRPTPPLSSPTPARLPSS